MKKYFVCLIFLVCAMIAPSMVAYSSNSSDSPVCPANAPCLYKGQAKNENGYTLQITVHRLDNYTTDLIAKFENKDGKIETVYVFPSGRGDGKWYFNWNGSKYWFEM